MFQTTRIDQEENRAQMLRHLEKEERLIAGWNKSNLRKIADSHRCCLNLISESDWLQAYTPDQYAVYVVNDGSEISDCYDGRIDYRDEMKSDSMRVMILMELLKNTIDFTATAKQFDVEVTEETKNWFAIMILLDVYRGSGCQIHIIPKND